MVDDINIESQFRFLFGNTKEYSRKIKFLNGVIYVYDNNYYFLTRSCFSKYKNKNFLFNKLKNIIQELSPSYIVDLNILYSNYLKPESVIQLSSALIDNDYKNYKRNDIFVDYIKLVNIEKKTKYLIQDTITINDTKNIHVQKLINNILNQSHNYNKIFIGSESIYLTMMLSNYFNIPCLCLGIVSNNSHIEVTQKIVNTFFSLF
jgi:hypothetical protein